MHFFDENTLRVRIGFFHLSSCSGCQTAFLDMFDELADVMEAIDIVYSDFLSESREIPKVDIAFVEGAFAVDYEPHEHLIDILSIKAKSIVAVGACASFGGIRRYSVGAQAPRPSHQAAIPITEVAILQPLIRYAIPGCPPNPSLLYNFILALLEVNEDFLKPFEAMAMSTMASGYDILTEVVNKGLCTGCGTCVSACPTRALEFCKRTQRPLLNRELCVNCGSCLAVCPQSFKPYPQPVY